MLPGVGRRIASFPPSLCSKSLILLDQFSGLGYQILRKNLEFLGQDKESADTDLMLAGLEFANVGPFETLIFKICLGEIQSKPVATNHAAKGILKGKRMACRI